MDIIAEPLRGDDHHPVHKPTGGLRGTGKRAGLVRARPFVRGERPSRSGQRHTVRGPWATGEEFEIERVTELWEPQRRVLWRDVAERLGGVRPDDMWHDGTWLEIRVEAEAGGTRVTIVGRQRPASGWQERLTAARPATERCCESRSSGSSSY